jgi:hypothetical protein
MTHRQSLVRVCVNNTHLHAYVQQGKWVVINRLRTGARENGSTEKRENTKVDALFDMNSSIRMRVFAGEGVTCATSTRLANGADGSTVRPAYDARTCAGAQSFQADPCARARSKSTASRARAGASN